MSDIIELKNNGDWIAFNRTHQNQFIGVKILNTSNVTDALTDKYTFVGALSGKARLKPIITRNKNANQSTFTPDFDVYSILGSQTTGKVTYIENAFDFDIAVGSSFNGQQDETDWVVIILENASVNTSIKIRILSANYIKYKDGLTKTTETNI